MCKSWLISFTWLNRAVRIASENYKMKKFCLHWDSKNQPSAYGSLVHFIFVHVSFKLACSLLWDIICTCGSYNCVKV